VTDAITQLQKRPRRISPREDSSENIGAWWAASTLVMQKGVGLNPTPSMVISHV
jgi:hypothetical protein